MRLRSLFQQARNVFGVQVIDLLESAGSGTLQLPRVVCELGRELSVRFDFLQVSTVGLLPMLQVGTALCGCSASFVLSVTAGPQESVRNSNLRASACASMFACRFALPACRYWFAKSL